jgi:hypothetical protein
MKYLGQEKPWLVQLRLQPVLENPLYKFQPCQGNGSGKPPCQLFVNLCQHSNFLIVIVIVMASKDHSFMF